MTTESNRLSALSFEPPLFRWFPAVAAAEAGRHDDRVDDDDFPDRAAEVFAPTGWDVGAWTARGPAGG